MTAIAYKAAEAIGARLGEIIPALANRVQVVQAPPNLDATYPAMAFEYLGRPRIDVSGDIEVRAGDGHGLVVGDGSAVVEVAALRQDARIWIGSRTPSQRERVQDLVLTAFFGDELAPGGLEVSLADVEVGGFKLPVPIPVACHLREAEWNDEMVMAERHQAFLYVSIDIPILVLRADAWRVSSMTAALAAAPNLTDDTASDEVLVSASGSVTPAP